MMHEYMEGLPLLKKLDVDLDDNLLFLYYSEKDRTGFESFFERWRDRATWLQGKFFYVRTNNVKQAFFSGFYRTMRQNHSGT